MTDATIETPEEPKRSKKPIFIAIAAAILLGVAAFAVMFLGVFQSDANQQEAAPGDPNSASHLIGTIAFVPMEPFTVSLRRDAENRHLKFTAQLEVFPGQEADVTHLLPRIRDVLNTYLSAVEASYIERPAGLIYLRAQMLRRVQLVTGSDMVRDLLVLEFVLI